MHVSSTIRCVDLVSAGPADVGGADQAVAEARAGSLVCPSDAMGIQPFYNSEICSAKRAFP